MNKKHSNRRQPLNYKLLTRDRNILTEFGRVEHDWRSPNSAKLVHWCKSTTQELTIQNIKRITNMIHSGLTVQCKNKL